MVAANSINVSTAGVVGFTGTAFVGNPLTQYNVAIGSTAGAIQNSPPSATSGVPFVSAGSSANPAAGTMVVAGGGTGVTSQAAYSVVCGGTSTTNPFQATGPNSSSNAILFAQGSTALPVFTTTGTAYMTGISFDAGSNTLSSFEEGTWVPSLSTVGTPSTITYDFQVGRYSKVGNGVNLLANIDVATYSAGTSTVVITIPYTTANVSGQAYNGPLKMENTTVRATFLYTITGIQGNSSVIFFPEVKTATGLNVMDAPELSATTKMMLTLWISTV